MNITDAVRAIVRDELSAILIAKPCKPEGEYLTTKQVAELTGLSISFFEVGRSHNVADRPPYARIGRRVLYRRSDIDNWLASRKRGGAK